MGVFDDENVEFEVENILDHRLVKTVKSNDRQNDNDKRDSYDHHDEPHVSHRTQNQNDESQRPDTEAYDRAPSLPYSGSKYGRACQSMSAHVKASQSISDNLRVEQRI